MSFEQKIDNYKNCIRFLRNQRLSTKEAEELIKAISQDIKQGITSYEQLEIKESKLYHLLEVQRGSNLRMNFRLLKETWYRKAFGIEIIQEIEDTLNLGGYNFENLRINREEFYSVKQQIQGAAK